MFCHQPSDAQSSTMRVKQKCEEDLQKALQSSFYSSSYPHHLIVHQAFIRKQQHRTHLASNGGEESITGQVGREGSLRGPGGPNIHWGFHQEDFRRAS